MNGLWNEYDGAYAAFEHNFPLAFPWKAPEKEDLPRYILGADGWWYDPRAKATGKAILSCTGDLMCEPAMTNACHFGDSYFFHPLFQFVRPILKGSDFAVANLETLIGNASPYAGEYHRVNRKFHCNGPESYLDALRYAGFDALVTANNHNCDAGIAGLFDTLNALDRHRFPHTGSFRSAEEPRVLLVKICGIKVAILSYATYYNRLDTTNFTELGKQTVLNRFSEEAYRRDAAYAREKGAEFILCYIHWGDDYDDVPNEEQYQILTVLKELDVDYILGSHTHCLQRHHVALSSTGKKIPMMFSMGNFITSETRELCKHTGILQLLLTRDGSGIRLEETLIPCYVHTEFAGYRYPVVPADPNLNGGHFGQKQDDIRAYVRNRVGDSLPFFSTGSVTLGEICKAMGASCPAGREKDPVTGLSTQAGTVRRGHLHFTLAEETPYAKREILRQMPCAVVCPAPIDGYTCIVVSDVAAAYKAACAAISKPACKTLLIAGKENKTLTRQLLKAVLEEKYKVYSQPDGVHKALLPWQKIHPATDFCLLELPEDHPMAAVLPETLAPDTVILTGQTQYLPALLATGAKIFCPAELAIPGTISYEKAPAGLPFDDQLYAAGAALAVGKALGIDPQLADAVSAYRQTDCTKNVIDVHGLRLLLQLSCATEDGAKSACHALSGETRRKIAVLGDSRWEDLAKKAGAERVFVLDKTERELERELLDALQDGDAVLFLGTRKDLLCVTVRRLFGITDGYIPNSEYWTGDEALII